LEELKGLYENRGIQLVNIGRAWAFRTAPDLAAAMKLEETTSRKLGRVATEILAIIAYHQPITRAEVEEIRGVSLSRGTLDLLLELDWIKPKGRRRTPGKPVTWGTTQDFLDHFGLQSLDSLPGFDELKAAGLIDARPAVTSLSARGRLFDADEAIDAEDGDEEEEFSENIDALLAADFGGQEEGDDDAEASDHEVGGTKEMTRAAESDDDQSDNDILGGGEEEIDAHLETDVQRDSTTQ
jgi:segregation and condensation protein B